MNLPRIGITLGDPGGIGPEIVVKSLGRLSGRPLARYVLFGTAGLVEQEERNLGLTLDRASVRVCDIGPASGSFVIGAADRVNGQASFRYFEEAVRAARTGEIEALVTAPVSKHSWALADVPWRGHTEYLESLFPAAIMTFWSAKMTVALFSHHLPLAEAVRKVTRDNLIRFFRLLAESLNRVKPAKYQFLVAGLNPHAGENGLLGLEERTEIVPAIAAARETGLDVRGPFSSDVVFRDALGHPEKVVVALYHDQGLIAFKLASFETGVNVTLGLPFIRTSPDHGTAFDIAGRNEAEPGSMIEAIILAGRLSARPF